MSRTKNVYDLGDKKVTIPGHAEPLNMKLGNYQIETCNVEEYVLVDVPGKSDLVSLERYYMDFNSSEFSGMCKYIIRGRVYINRTTPINILGVPLPIRKTVWEIQTGIITPLYSPKKSAKEIIEKAKKHDSIENQGVEIRLDKLEYLLTDALDPYMRRARFFCLETKQFDLYEYDTDR